MVVEDLVLHPLTQVFQVVVLVVSEMKIVFQFVVIHLIQLQLEVVDLQVLHGQQVQVLMVQIQ